MTVCSLQPETDYTQHTDMKKIILKRLGYTFLTGLLITGSVAGYMLFKPHRDVQATDAYAIIEVSSLVKEFETDAIKANAKYLSGDGNSKVLIVEGRISKILTNQVGEQVIILQDAGAKMGVSATLTKATSLYKSGIKTGDIIKIKGAIASGNHYDADLDLYDHAVLIQCAILK